MELKKVPKCAALVVGYNVLGEFTLWYVLTRALSNYALVGSRFSSELIALFIYIYIVFCLGILEDLCFGFH